MLNRPLFKAELVKNGYTFKKMAGELGMSERTFSKRVKTGDFGSSEIDIMIPLLHLDDPRPFFCSISNLISYRYRKGNNI